MFTQTVSYNPLLSIFTTTMNTMNFLWKHKKYLALLLFMYSYVKFISTKENEIKFQDVCKSGSDWPKNFSSCFFSPTIHQGNIGFKNWNDFRDYQLVTHTPEDMCDSSSGFYFTAVDDNAKQQEGFMDRWFIILRDGLYTAQVDQAMADIYRLFLGHAPEIQIIKDMRNENEITIPEMQEHYQYRNNEPKYYIASRGIKDFITWSKYYGWFGHNAVKYKNLKMLNLGKLLAIASFFGEGDLAGVNFGFKVTKYFLIAYKIDNSKALYFDCLNEPFDRNDIDQLPTCMDIPPDFEKFIENDVIQKEKREMFLEIANTDFNIMEDILRYYITSTNLETGKWNTKYAMDNVTGFNSATQFINRLNPEEYGVNAIVKKIRQRHQKLQEIFENPNFQLKI